MELIVAKNSPRSRHSPSSARAGRPLRLDPAGAVAFLAVPLWCRPRSSMLVTQHLLRVTPSPGLSPRQRRIEAPAAGPPPAGGRERRHIPPGIPGCRAASAPSRQSDGRFLRGGRPSRADGGRRARRRGGLAETPQRALSILLLRGTRYSPSCSRSPGGRHRSRPGQLPRHRGRSIPRRRKAGSSSRDRSDAA
jgi:hypothetical protein